MTYDEALNITSNYCLTHNDQLSEAIQKVIEQNDILKETSKIEFIWEEE